MNDNRHFRSFPRQRATLTVTIYRQETPQTALKKIVAFTDNIGLGGLFAATDEAFVVGERVEVELSTPSTWSPVRFKAEVLRTKGDEEGQQRGVGLQFVEMTDAQAVALEEFAEFLDFNS